MGSGGMGELEKNEKYVVILEAEGPRTKAQANKFNEKMEEVMKGFDAKRRYSYRAVKTGDDQK